MLQEHKERRRKEPSGDEGRRTQVIIRLRGEFIETQAANIETIMKMIAKEAQIHVDTEESNVVGNPKQWKKLIHARYGWSGDVLVKCTDEDEAIRLYQRVEGKALEIGGGGKVTIEIFPHAKVILDARTSRAASS